MFLRVLVVSCRAYLAPTPRANGIMKMLGLLLADAALRVGSLMSRYRKPGQAKCAWAEIVEYPVVQTSRVDVQLCGSYVLVAHLASFSYWASYEAHNVQIEKLSQL
jgi:hypothetical protein